MVSTLGSGHHVPLTKEEAAEQLADLMCRCGMYVGQGSLLEMLEKHWSKVSYLSHAIHDDYRPPNRATGNSAYDDAIEGMKNRRQP